MNRRLLAASLLVFVAIPLVTVQACGPDFVPDVFVRKLRPDNPEEFVAGKLGVLLPTYPRADLTIAFRYLNGGSLTAEEQKAYQPLYSYYTEEDLNQHWQETEAAEQKEEASDPIEGWRKARAKYTPEEERIRTNREVTVTRPDGTTFAPDYENCNIDAFRTAVLTLNSRVKTWGDKNSDLMNWLKGQDAVFANCHGGAPVIPDKAPTAASTLLKADRAYQIAAAQFYAGQFEVARAGFEAISKDQQSPWHGIARYLVARCLVRQAFFSPKTEIGETMAEFDSDPMEQAATLLKSMLNEKYTGVSKEALENELNFIRLRLEPTMRLRELSEALVGPKTDPNYAAHLEDLTWYLNAKLDPIPVRQDSSSVDYEYDPKTQTSRNFTPAERLERFNKTYHELAQFRSTSTLIDWLITFQSPAPDAKKHSITEWKKTGQIFWFIAALSKTSEKDPEAPALVKAAEQIQPDSPAWETVTYHRIRLLTGLGRVHEARLLLDQVMPRIQANQQDSVINLFRGLHMHSAANLEEALTYTPRKILEKTSEERSSVDECLAVMKNPMRKYDCVHKIDPLQFSTDAVRFLNEQASLETLLQAAKSPSLPEQLRRSVAMMAWVRSVLLKNEAAAAQLLPLLPEKLRQQASPGSGFHPLMTILRNPGLRPYLDGGIQRSYSYDFVESYRDNWWCGDWQTTYLRDEYGFSRNETTEHFDLPPAFQSQEQTDQAAHEQKELMQMGSAKEHLGELVLTYAKDHPDDPDIAESLYLVLRTIRYGCDSDLWQDSSIAQERQKRIEAIRQSAARLLRRRYAASPWTKKAAPFVG